MIFIVLGGMLGALCRFSISEWLNSNILSTWIVNLMGSFFLVALYFIYNEGTISDSLYSFLGVGFSGAFTTFSTVNNQIFEYLIAKNFKDVLLLNIATYIGITFSVFLFYLLFYYFTT